MFDSKRVESPIGGSIADCNRVAGARRAFAGAAAKRAARIEIADESGAGGAGGDRRECVVQEMDETGWARGDVGS